LREYPQWFLDEMVAWRKAQDEWAMGPDSYGEPCMPHYPKEWQTATCKYCKYKGLVWIEGGNGKWRLMTPNQSLHLCKAKRKYDRTHRREKLGVGGDSMAKSG
jgi:ligand-binding sensor domain-containing protein